MDPTDTTVGFRFEGAGNVPQIFTVRAVDSYGRESDPSEEVSLTPPVVTGFNTLNAAGNTDAYGIWSDGETMWVVDDVDDKLYAYNLATKEHTSDIDIALHADNITPRDLWSDGSTMWVVNNEPNAIFAYDMNNNGARVTGREFTATNLDATNLNPTGIWSDGTTMWVVSVGGVTGNHIFAYNMVSKARDMDKEFELVGGSNSTYRALWSNDGTMWVLDGTKILAYTLDDPDNFGARNEDLEFPSVTVGIAPNLLMITPWGIWSNQSPVPPAEPTMWMSERNAIRAFSLNTKMHIP